MSIETHDDYVTGLLERLHTDVVDAAELSLLGLDLDQLNRWLIAMTRLVSQAQGLQAAAMQEADAAGLSAAFGSRVLTTHLVKETNGPVQAVGADRSLALWLRDFPVFHRAMIDGTFTRSHVVALKDIDSVNVHGFLQRDQHMLVDGARDFDWVEWNKLVAYWLNAANPDGTLSDPTDPKYGMTIRTRANGDVAVSILMDPITGEAFLTMHDAEVEKLSRAEREDPNCVPESLRHKNLTALMKLLIRGWRRADGSEPTPLVNIVMSQKVAEDLLARTFGHQSPPHGWDVSASMAETPFASGVDPFELPISWDDIDGRCETIRGTPVHPTHALGLLLAGKLRRTIMTAESRVMDLGHDVRFFTKAQRNALLVQSRGQCVDGSQAPFAWLQADHVHPHSKGGPTNLANGAMRSRPDNHAKGTKQDWY